jgi:hypothetical protein
MDIEVSGSSVYENKPIKVNIYDLYRNINEKKEKKLSNFNEILYKIHNKIKKAAEVEKYNIVYQVPEFIFGIPNYNLDKCTAYLIKELRSNGFLVRYYFPKILYVSWNPIEIKKYKKEKILGLNNKFKSTKKNIYELTDLNNNYKNSRIDIDTKITNNKTNSIVEYQNNPQDNLFHLKGENTQYKSEVFKPILQYDPNIIPTYNYYAYSSLNQNVVNDTPQNINIQNSIQNQDYNLNQMDKLPINNNNFIEPTVQSIIDIENDYNNHYNNHYNNNHYNNKNTKNINNNKNTKNINNNKNTKNINNNKNTKNKGFMEDKFNKFLKKKEEKNNEIMINNNYITRESLDKYQNDINDYYDEKPSIPFKNSIQNSKGKFVLDLR